MLFYDVIVEQKETKKEKKNKKILIFQVKNMI